MDKAALAQEKIWFDKPSYDKAERLYFERMAMVVSRNIMESCSLKSEISVTDTCQNIISNNGLTKMKTEKSKDNKLLILENGTNDTTKSSKRQAKASNINKLEEDSNVHKKETCEEREKGKEKHYGAKNDRKEKEISSSSDTAKKYNAKEAKEKKNKADTIHRNRERGENDTKEVKENVAPVIRNKEQLPNQGKQQTTSPVLPAGGSLANEVAKARQHIKQSLQCVDDIAAVVGMSTPNADSKKDNLDVYNALRNIVQKLEERVKNLEDKVNSTTCLTLAVCPAKPATDAKQQSAKDEDEEDVDLFDSESEGEDTEAAKIREERLAAYAAKKSKKPVLIAKSNIILDVKPWDDETDMKVMEAEVRKIETDGLLWGAAKLVPLAFGIHKLQISCVVEDDKVSVDWLTEKIQEIEDYIQSVDIAAFNKV